MAPRAAKVCSSFSVEHAVTIHPKVNFQFPNFPTSWLDPKTNQTKTVQLFVNFNEDPILPIVFNPINTNYGVLNNLTNY